MKINIQKLQKQLLEKIWRMRKLAKENANLSVEDVKLVVDALNASIEELQLKAVVTINNNDQIETKYCEIGEQVRSCCTDCNCFY